jgi:hypothetical protein
MRAADDFGPPRPQFDHELGVEGHEPANRPDLCREEVGSNERGPMRREKRAPGRRPLTARRNALGLEDARNRRSGHAMAPHSSTHRGSACNPSSDCPSPCRSPDAGFASYAQAGRGAAERRSLPGDQASVPIGESCRVSRAYALHNEGTQKYDIRAAQRPYTPTLRLDSSRVVTSA